MGVGSIWPNNRIFLTMAGHHQILHQLYHKNDFCYDKTLY
jgi:hypothetical protein